MLLYTIFDYLIIFCHSLIYIYIYIYIFFFKVKPDCLLVYFLDSSLLIYSMKIENLSSLCSPECKNSKNKIKIKNILSCNNLIDRDLKVNRSYAKCLGEIIDLCWSALMNFDSCRSVCLRGWNEIQRDIRRRLFCFGSFGTRKWVISGWGRWG